MPLPYLVCCTTPSYSKGRQGCSLARHTPGHPGVHEVTSVDVAEESHYSLRLHQADKDVADSLIDDALRRMVITLPDIR